MGSGRVGGGSLFFPRGVREERTRKGARGTEDRGGKMLGAAERTTVNK